MQIEAVQIQDDNVTVVVVKRNPGQGEFVGMNFIFSDGQNSEIIRENTTLGELDQGSFTFELSEINASNIKTVSVAPIYMLSSGRETAGNVADKFDVPANKSLGAEQENGGVTGGAISKFESHGFKDFGVVEYDVQSGPETEIPTFSKVIIDPLDVRVGQTQTFTAYVSSPYNITNVTTFTELDTTNLTLPLELQGDGSWSASWNVYDTHQTTYTTTFFATDSAGNENNVTLTWTDPTSCSTFITQGSDSIIDGSCTLSASEINGIDAAKIQLNTGGIITLSSDAALVYSPGYSITKTGTGKIIDGGGSIRKGYMYFFGSGTTATNGTPVFSVESSPPGGYITVRSATSITNCNTANSIVPKTGPATCTASCNDPDGGIVDGSATTVTTVTGNTCTLASCSGSSGTDTCVDVKLTEYYCSGNSLASVVNDCMVLYGVGCTNGACDFG